MKKKDIWISIAIITAAVLSFCLYSLADSLVKGSIKIDADNAMAVLQIRSVLFSQKKNTNRNRADYSKCTSTQT